MKITRDTVKQIIKEELSRINETAGDGKIDSSDAEVLKRLAGDISSQSSPERELDKIIDALRTIGQDEIADALDAWWVRLDYIPDDPDPHGAMGARRGYPDE